jgi:quinol-cytochrome oxidoreductase complex cytochrome b subunit
MATTIWTQQWLEQLRQTRLWRSIFRRGPARTNRTRSLAVFGNLGLHVLPVKVREKSLSVRATYYLGSISFFLFVVLTITGILLMFYYHPAVPDAYRDMKDLIYVVSNGVFLRNLHRLAAQAMVVAVFWHMFHVFYRGGYKPPHEFNWVIGVGLLLVTLFLSYTGYLLPWDQLAFWAITVGTNIISYIPVLGRFYVLHCVILPLAAVALIAAHFWRIQKDGGLTVRDDHE